VPLLLGLLIELIFSLFGIMMMYTSHDLGELCEVRPCLCLTPLFHRASTKKETTARWHSTDYTTFIYLSPLAAKAHPQENSPPIFGFINLPAF